EVSGGDIQKQFPTEAAQQMLKIRGELAQPAYVNLNMGNQYLVLKVEGVRVPQMSAEELAQAKGMMAEMRANDVLTAYLSYLERSVKAKGGAQKLQDAQ
ncbi:MAG: hypothetical protein KA214_10595, partial [Neisseriaceae bacterium]|nr:hypothetical protein [Neisseriaceae bacterium]